MALNNIPIGKSIADYIVANAPTPGTPVSTTQLETLWEGIMGLIYSDMKANMDVLPAGHSGPGLENPSGQAGEVTSGPGAGGVTTTTAPIPIIGLGSVN
jgi:hypothetical protein